MRGFFLVSCMMPLLCLAAETGEAPYANLGTVANLRVLAHCTEQLNTVGPSAAVLSTAMMAYVNLALDDDLRVQGDRGGQWRQAARRLAEELARLPDRADADPRPGLWLDVLEGRTRACVAGIEEQGLSDTSHGRALRLFATADVRIVDADDPEISPHERYALAFAGLRNGVAGDIVARLDGAALPPVGWALLSAKVSRRTLGLQRTWLRAVLRQVPLLLMARDLDDSEALHWGNALLAALAQPPASRRSECVNRLDQALCSEKDWQGAVLVAAWRACEALRRRPAAIRTEAGVWRLCNGPLWARKVRTDLFLAIWNWHALLRQVYHKNEAADRVREAFQTEDCALPAAIIALIDQDEVALDRCEALFEQEMSDPAGLRVVHLANAVRVFSVLGLDRRKRILRSLCQAVAPEAGAPFQRTPYAILAQLKQVLEKTVLDPVQLDAARAADPWSVHWTLCGTGFKYWDRGRAATALAETLPWRIDLLVHRADQSAERGFSERAEPLYRQARAVWPEAHEICLKWAQTLVDSGQHAEGLAELQRIQPLLEDYFDGLKAQRYLGRAYEGVGDLIRADAWYARAAQSQGPQELEDYAFFSLRQGAWARTRTLLKQRARRLRGAFAQALLVLVDLLDPAVPEVVARAGLQLVDLEALKEGGNNWAACQYFGRYGHSAAWRSLLTDPSELSNDLCYTAIWSHLAGGQFAEALAAADVLVDGGRRNLRHTWRREAELYQHQLQRLCGQPGFDAEAWADFHERSGVTARQHLVAQVLSGAISREEGLQRSGSIDAADDLLCWLALEDLVAGASDSAQDLFAQFLAQHQDWNETTYARGLIDWMATWDEATRERYNRGIVPTTTTSDYEIEF